MKSIFTFLVLIITVNINSFAQDSLGSKITEPDFPFEPIYLDSNFIQTPLPQEHYEIIQKYGGSKGAEITYEINTANSSLIINKRNPIKLILKQGLINGTMTNVKDIYYLYKTKQDGQKRKCMVGHVKSTGLIFQDGFDIVYKKIKSDIFLLTINNLEPGEYILVATVTKTNLFSFSVK